jgi:glycine/D-amino acid oxidase-like deaminating enzyme
LETIGACTPIIIENIMSYWLGENLELQSYCTNPKLYDDEVYDVVIVGSGITGASAAYHLAANDSSLKILVLEKEGISSGATGCNGGFISPGTSEKFSSSVERYGLEVTQEIFDYTVSCSKLIQEFVTSSRTECELRMNGSVMLAYTEEELTELKLSYDQLVSFGVEVVWWDAEECRRRTRSQDYLGGIFKPKAGLLWAAKLVFSIIEKAISMGVHVQTNTPVLGVDNKNGQITVSTTKGTVQCKHVIYCTNAWTRELLAGYNEVIVPVRNQVIAAIHKLICVLLTVDFAA